MAYRSPLETRLAKKATRAITDFHMVEQGDRVMVGLSGGKDSWALIQILDVLRQRAPIDFSIVAVNVDSGYEGYQHPELARACSERGWELHIEHTSYRQRDRRQARRDRYAVLEDVSLSPRRAGRRRRHSPAGRAA